MSGPANVPARTMPRTIAVTGALGFVASHLLPKLAAAGARALLVVRPGREAAARAAYPGLEIRTGELARPETLRDTFAGAEAVVHLAGMSLAPEMLPAMLAAGVASGVFVSSAGVHTKLISPAADAKRRGERAVWDSPLAGIVLRPSMIYGTPRDRNLIRLIAWIDRWGVVPAPLGGITPQQPVHVEDLAQAIVAALAPARESRAEYDVGGPQPLPLAEMVRAIGRALDRPAWVLPLPLAPAHAAAEFAKRFRLPFPVRPEQVLRLTESKAVDIAPARADLGFAPCSFADGIAAEVAMYRAQRARN